MSFSIDHSKASGLTPQGEYECVIAIACQRVTRKGTPYIDISLKFREDVEQNPLKSGKISHTIWTKREPTEDDAACDGYSARQIQNVSRAVGMTDGAKYESVDDWCEDLTGRLLRAQVRHVEFDGLTHARVAWVDETRFPNVKEKEPEKSEKRHELADDDEFLLMDDDDDGLPF